MASITFYEIPASAYLFGKSDSNPEEKVRQWALFELLSTYGISITNIRIEFPVQIGSKRYSADIVVLKDGRPYIVIECKSEHHDYNDWEQVTSYANQLQTEFAVWTNGRKWQVKRNFLGKWCPAADLPHRQNLSAMNFSDHLETIRFLARLFYWHNCQLPIEHVPLFLSNVTILMSSITVHKLSSSPQCLLDGFNHLCYLADECDDHRARTDLLLQQGLLERLTTVLQTFKEYFELIDYDGKVENIAVDMDMDKDLTHISELKRYVEDKLNNDLQDNSGQTGKSVLEAVFWQAMSLSWRLRELARWHVDLTNHEVAFLAASEVVSRYLEDKIYPNKPHIFSEGQVDQILKIFELVYLAPLNMHLPTKLDPTGTQQLHNFCEYYWQETLAIHELHRKENASCR